MRNELARCGIELIAPHHKNRRNAPPQDDRALRRYQRRGTVERTIACVGNFRRRVVRRFPQFTRPMDPKDLRGNISLTESSVLA